MSVTPEIQTQNAYRWSVAGGFFLFVVAATYIFGHAVDAGLNHDEHQFLAPAALFSREGLLPWKDFPLFHLPNLVFLYGLLDWLTGNLILSAKLVGAVATGALTAGLITANIASRRVWNWIAALAVVGLLISDPLVLETTGKTWNHELPTSLLVAALALMVAAAKQDRLGLTAAAGLAGGLAAGCRLTFAPALVGLAVMTWFHPGSVRRRIAHLLTLVASSTIALAPSLYFLAVHQEAFVFGNLEFPRLRLADPTNTRIQKTMSLWRKLRFFLKEVALPSWPVFALWGAVAVKPAWHWFRSRSESDRGLAFLLILLPFVLAGCFAPSRYQYQHFYVFIPLLLLGASWGLGSMTLQGRTRNWVLVGATVLGVMFSARTLYQSPTRRMLADRANWFDARLARQEAELQANVPEGPVLTLAPALPLAVGRSIYPEFATGPFAWRSAPFLAARRRTQLRIVAPDDLAALLQARPPAAILTGVEEDDLEKPLIEWAKTNRFTSVGLKKKQTLWLPPPSGDR